MGTESILRHRLSEISYQLDDMAQKKAKTEGRSTVINQTIADLERERDEIRADMTTLGFDIGLAKPN